MRLGEADSVRGRSGGNNPKANKSRTLLRSELQEWMKRATELLTKFINTLQECDRELDFFFSKGIYYFCTPIPSLTISETSVARLALVDQERHELHRLLIKLQHIKLVCRNILRDVSRNPPTTGSDQLNTDKTSLIFNWPTKAMPLPSFSKAPPETLEYLRGLHL